MIFFNCSETVQRFFSHFVLDLAKVQASMLPIITVPVVNTIQSVIGSKVAILQQITIARRKKTTQALLFLPKSNLCNLEAPSCSRSPP